MTTKTAKATTAATVTEDEKKPDELTLENTADGDGGQNTTAGLGDTGVGLTGSETNGATGLTGAEVA